MKKEKEVLTDFERRKSKNLAIERWKSKIGARDLKMQVRSTGLKKRGDLNFDFITIENYIIKNWSIGEFNWKKNKKKFFF